MCHIAANRFFLAFIYVPGRYKIQEMCDRVISEDPFMLLYCPHRCKTQGICDEDVDNSLATFKFFSDWLLQLKCLKNWIVIYTLMMICSFVMKIFVNSHLLLIKNIWFLYILIKLILAMIMILMKMILRLLFISGFWLGVVNLKNAKHLKKDKWRIKAYSVSY